MGLIKESRESKFKKGTRVVFNISGYKSSGVVLAQSDNLVEVEWDTGVTTWVYKTSVEIVHD